MLRPLEARTEKTRETEDYFFFFAAGFFAAAFLTGAAFFAGAFFAAAIVLFSIIGLQCSATLSDDYAIRFWWKDGSSAERSRKCEWGRNATCRGGRRGDPEEAFHKRHALPGQVALVRTFGHNGWEHQFAGFRADLCLEGGLARYATCAYAKGMMDADQKITVAALYRFAPWPRFAEHRAALLDIATANGVKGTLLLAAEGINGTIAGARAGLDHVLDAIRAIPELGDTDVKFSTALEMPFGRLKVRLKKEIVTMGVEGIDPLRVVGTYVEPKDWNALISDPDTLLIDTRNAYEVGIGTFEGAVDPDTRSFREFPQWVEARLSRSGSSGVAPKRVAMFCTGGIRCEKATALVKSLGVEEVYHLKGGILKYLEVVPEAESLWRGDCYVFDERVAVGHGLAQSGYKLCHTCGAPIAVPSAEEGGGFVEGGCAACREASKSN